MDRWMDLKMNGGMNERMDGFCKSQSSPAMSLKAEFLPENLMSHWRRWMAG